MLGLIWAKGNKHSMYIPYTTTKRHLRNVQNTQICVAHYGQKRCCVHRNLSSQDQKPLENFPESHTQSVVVS